MSSNRASVIPLALFLKPQSPAKRLAAQQRYREKLQWERQLKELQEAKADWLHDSWFICEVHNTHKTVSPPTY